MAAGGALLVHSALVARTDWLVHLSPGQLLDAPFNSQWIHMFEDIQSNAVLTFISSFTLPKTIDRNLCRNADFTSVKGH
jgi:hypothetical protein